jgi:heat shock protein HslJ
MRTLFLLPIAPLLLAGCLAHPLPPDAPYHAVARDNQWNLVIDDMHVTFIRAGQEPIRQPRPQPAAGAGAQVYHTPRIHVEVTPGACTIGDRIFPDSVQVRVDGRAHSGCGGVPQTASAPSAGLQLANTRWRVAQVNGRATPRVGDYVMSFEAENIGARFGCNHMGGNYRLSGRTLVVDNLSQTLIGCPEPSASFENQGGAILGRPMQVESAQGGRLVLSNQAGSISLEPAT